MRKNYDIIGGRLLPTDDLNSKIQVFINPNETERLYLIGELNLDEHTLSSALDPDELSRVEFEPQHVAIIFKRPENYSQGSDFLFRVSSMGLYLFQDRLIAVMSEDETLFSPGKDVSNITGGLHELLIRLINRSIAQFLGHIRAISMIVDELEKKLETAMSNKHLLHLFRLSQSMTYYLSAISSNGVLIDKLRGYSAKIGFTPENNELLEDLTVDNTQCYKQAEIYSIIMASMTDARASVVSNNLNMLMKQLTVLSIVFLPLNVIASVFGMSEYTTFTEKYVTWPVAYLLFSIGLVGVGYITYWILRRTGLD
ncbi:MAG: magnesium transporter CorA family protein [Planctomycetaceae bacterium]|jgi:magnesium transporter|nr:magnesium transporter CorA family protein [Planctomycetaceae bacterium]